MSSKILSRSARWGIIWGALLLGSVVALVLVERRSTVASVPAAPVRTAMPAAFVTPAEAVRGRVFGYSTQGREIAGYEIGSGDDVLLLYAAIHGDEKNTTDLLNRFVAELRNNPAMVATTNKVIVIPSLNPDGYASRSDKLNANGVNLNRNFATSGWRRTAPGISFSGPSPFSEVESVVLRNVVQQYQPGAMIAFHSQGGLVSPESDAGSIALAKWYANITGYTYEDSWEFIGTATDWFAQTIGLPAITVELYDHKSSDWEVNKEVLFALVASQSGR